jgi:hypothetical protein
MGDLKLHFEPDKPHSTKGTLIVFGNEEKPMYSDTLDIANSKKRIFFVKEVVQKYPGIEAEILEQAILDEVARITTEKCKAKENTEDIQETDPLVATPQEVKEAALELLKSENLFEQVIADIAAIGVAGEENLALMLYVIMTSRLLDKPLSAIVQGASASGKSFTIETVAKLMPPEAVVQAHDFTNQALYYLPGGSLKHKVVISGERVQEYRHNKDGYAEDNTKAFREMVGSGELRKAVTVKGPAGRPTTALIHQPGPIAYLESTTAANIHDEDSTRLLPLATDESASQTRKVVEAQRREAKGQIISETKRQEIIRRHHTMQRLLKPLAIRITYIDTISLPETKIVTRRTNEQFFSALRSVALLRQYQKIIQYDETTSQEYIEADEIDYEIVYRIMNTVLERTYSPLNQQSRDLLQTMLQHTGRDIDFTQKDCEQWCGVSNATVRRRLSPLVSIGAISVNADSKPYQYRVVHPELAEATDLNLPTPEDIKERIAIMSE